MDKRTLTAIFLMLGIYYVWMAVFPPPAPEVPAEQATEQQAAEQVADAPAPAPAAPPADAAVPSDQPVTREGFELCQAKGEVVTDNGRLVDTVLPGHEAKYEMQSIFSWAMSGFDGPWKPYGEDPGPEVLFGSHAQGLVAGAGPVVGFRPGATTREADGALTVTSTTAEGLQITRSLRPVEGEPCLLTMDVTWRNNGSSTFSGDLWVGIHDVLPEESTRYAAAMRPIAMVDGDVEQVTDLDDMRSEPETFEGGVSWFGMADGYFGTYVLPAGKGGAGVVMEGFDADGAAVNGLRYLVRAPLSAGSQHTETFRVYMGPRDLDVLKVIDEDLEEAMQFGFFSFFAVPLLWLLKTIQGVVSNWGVAIILLTVVIKLVFFPLTQSSFKSSQAMQAIQPQLKAVREQYKEDPQKLNAETMRLFQENGVNPLGGCLPMVVQMPVWFALYSALLGSVELYHTDFLYLKDLSAVDPYMILPALAVGMMMLQQQMMPTGNMDPAQARIMKLMPLMFGIFFFSFPAGLSLYIFVNILLSMAQQWYIKRTFKVAGAAA